MFDITNNIEINNIDYKYRIININNLLFFLETNKFRLSFEEIIKEHKNDYTIDKLIQDSKKIKKNTKFMLLYTNNHVVHIERFVFSNNSKSTYLDFIHTHSNYRQRGIGNACLFYLIKNTEKYFKIFELKVRSDNVNAIKLYKKNNFKIISKTIQKNKNENIEVLIMNYKTKNKK